MTNIDDEITAIKARIATAQKEKIRAEAIKESALTAEDTAMQKLKDEFGVDNLGDARAKLEELQSNLQSQLEEVKAALDNIEL